MMFDPIGAAVILVAGVAVSVLVTLRVLLRTPAAGKRGWRRWPLFRWLVPGVLLACFQVLLLPEAIYTVRHPHLRKGPEVGFSWDLIVVAPLVLLLAIWMVQEAFRE